MHFKFRFEMTQFIQTRIAIHKVFAAVGVVLFLLPASASGPFAKPFGHGSVLKKFNHPVCIHGSVSAALVSPNGRTLYIGGNFTQVAKCTGGGVALSTVTGLKPESFDWHASGVIGTVSAVISDGVGGWYIGGSFTTIGKTTRVNLARITSAHLVDETFIPPALNGAVGALHLIGTDLYVGGSFIYVDATARPYFAKLNASTGALIPGLDAGLNGSVNSIVSSGSTLYLGGTFTVVNSPFVGSSGAAIDTTTSLANTNFPQVNGTVSAVINDGVGGWYIGGNFTQVGPLARNNLAQIDSLGNVTSFNPNMNGAVNALALTGTSLYAGGLFTSVNGGTTRNYLAAIDTTTGTATSFNPNMNSQVSALALTGTSLYAGGWFTTVNGGTTRNYLAAIDTTTGTATSFNPNMNGAVSALALTGTSLYAGGWFTSVNGGTTRNRLAAIDTTTGTATSFNPDMNSQVNALALTGTSLYAGGSFTSVNGGTKLSQGLCSIRTTDGQVQP